MEIQWKTNQKGGKGQTLIFFLQYAKSLIGNAYLGGFDSASWQSETGGRRRRGHRTVTGARIGRRSTRVRIRIGKPSAGRVEG